MSDPNLITILPGIVQIVDWKPQMSNWWWHAVKWRDDQSQLETLPWISAPTFMETTKIKRRKLKQPEDTHHRFTELHTLTVSVHDVNHSTKTTDHYVAVGTISLFLLNDTLMCVRERWNVLVVQLCTCGSGFAPSVLSNIWCLGMKGCSLFPMLSFVYRDVRCTFKCPPHPLHFSSDWVIKVARDRVKDK